jgi:hypothetical protein
MDAERNASSEKSHLLRRYLRMRRRDREWRTVRVVSDRNQAMPALVFPRSPVANFALSNYETKF